MPRVVQKTLSFPLSGVSRRGGYREQTRPYSAPWAVNVRGVAPLEHRNRGGSRPGLSKVVADRIGDKITAVVPVSYVDPAGVLRQDIMIASDGALTRLQGGVASITPATLLHETGVTILAEDGTEIVFPSTVSAINPIGDTDAFDAVERNGKLLVADSVLREFDPITGIVADVTAVAGVVPTGCPLVTVYRDRVFLAGADHVWYASRQSAPGDWAFGKDMGDMGRAVAGQVGGAGRIGDVIQAMIPDGDRSMLFLSRNGAWLLRGDPVDGTLQEVSNEIGCLSPTAWARSPDGVIAFLGSDGIYVTLAGSSDAPKRWSSERVPDELRNVDPDTNTITMGWDVRSRGFHLFVTPANGDGIHWWMDLENKALWPVHLPTGMQPVAVARLQGASGMSELVLGCKDGYLRKFDDDALDDDSIPIESHVILGPFSLAPNGMQDGMIAEIHGVLSENAGKVEWRIVSGTSAEVVADAAVTGIIDHLSGFAGLGGVASLGEWKNNRNRVDRPRARGPWAAVWLRSSSRWAYEDIALRINQLGRVRWE